MSLMIGCKIFWIGKAKSLPMPTLAEILIVIVAFVFAGLYKPLLLFQAPYIHLD
jgi:hypothetical protein